MYPDSTDVNRWVLIGDNYRVADQVDAARVWYNRALEIEPDNERALNALSQTGQP